VSRAGAVAQLGHIKEIISYASVGTELGSIEVPLCSDKNRAGQYYIQVTQKAL
jgi:hypothetical protein